MGWSNNRKFVFVGALIREGKEWDLNTGVKVNNITTGTSTSQITQLSFAKSPESDHLLVARIDGCVTIQDVRTGQVVKNFELPDKCPPWCVAVISVLWVGKEDDKWGRVVGIMIQAK